MTLSAPIPQASSDVPPALPSIGRSEAWAARARGLIPSLTQTLAKGPTQYVQGVAPIYLQRGKGCHVWDVDGNRYIDLTMAVGPLSLGYCHPRVDEAIRKQLEHGITFSLMHPLEVQVSERLRRLIPGAERVRFSKTGADVTSAAIRLARAHTGRTRVLCCGYHGWHDWYAGVLPRGAGVPREVSELVETFPYNDLMGLSEKLDDRVAAVILEPMIFEAPAPGFLEGVRRLCTERGTVLVFDEMWTGFRLALGGAQEHFGVQADLACFSKAMANGMPLSALTGRAAILDRLEQEVFFFTTFGGEALSLAACDATLAELEAEAVPRALAERGDRFQTAYRQLLGELDIPFGSILGMPARSLITFGGIGVGADPLEMKSLVQQELLRRGVLWTGFFNVSHAHTDRDIDQVLDAFRGALLVLREAVQRGDVRPRIQGAPVEPVFRKTQ